MGQQLQRRTPGPPDRQPEPSWSAVAGTTVHLWLQRHHIVGEEPAGRRRRFVVVLCALVAMALGAGVTLAFTRTSETVAKTARGTATALQVAAKNRQDAANWVAAQVNHSVYVSCDQVMCSDVQTAGFPGSQLQVLQPTAPDPLGAELVIATPAIQSQFGVRLAAVYAPLVLASFGTGAEQVAIRYIPPDGTKAFNAELGPDLKARMIGGGQLLASTRIDANPAAQSQLRAGQVDPRLLAMLSALAHQMPIKLVAFDVASPGASSAVPLRGAEIGVASADLSTMLAFLTAQQAGFAPAGKPAVVRLASGQTVVTVRYAAPSPLGVGGLESIHGLGRESHEILGTI